MISAFMRILDDASIGAKPKKTVDDTRSETVGVRGKAKNTADGTQTLTPLPPSLVISTDQASQDQASLLQRLQQIELENTTLRNRLRERETPATSAIDSKALQMEHSLFLLSPALIPETSPTAVGELLDLKTHHTPAPVLPHG